MSVQVKLCLIQGGYGKDQTKAKQEFRTVFDHALQLGINFIDTHTQTMTFVMIWSNRRTE